MKYEPGNGTKSVEYHRDIKPIFERSCAACHTAKDGREPAGNLVLDDDAMVKTQNPAGLGFDITVPGTYARLAADAKGQWGHKPLHRHGWTHLANSASRYVRMMQSRRSLLIWKVFGERLDGWQNDDFPHETVPGDPTSLRHKGKPVADSPQVRELAHTAYTGSVMPPPDAVKAGKVKPLTPEDKLTLVRWIDLGCPIDLTKTGNGWALDEQRPTLALTCPKAGANDALTRILIGVHDCGTGLDAASLSVVADFPLDGAKAGEELAEKFREVSPGVWELKPAKPLASLPKGTLTVSVKDKQGNVTRVGRTFSVGPAGR